MNFFRSKSGKFVILLCVIFLTPIKVLSSVEKCTLLSFDDEKRDAILFPFGYFQYVDKKKNINKVHKEIELKGFAYPNPWLDSQNFIVSLREYVLNKSSVNIDKTLRDLDALMAHFVKSGYIFPRPRYKQYEEGWVSCMDALPELPPKNWTQNHARNLSFS